MLKKQIPNLVTCANLLCGCMAIVVAIEGGSVTYIAYLVWLGAFFDFFDGLLARVLNVSGEMGKQLDSMADLITFGVTPFLTIYLLLGRGFSVFTLSALLLVACSAWRLAKFNIDKRQTTTFMGLPTPANALFFTGLPFFLEKVNLTLTPIVSMILVFFFSILMVVDLPMLSLKVKEWKFSGNEAKLVLVIAGIIAVGGWQLAGISALILFYVLLSIVVFLSNKKVH